MEGGLCGKPMSEALPGTSKGVTFCASESTVNGKRNQSRWCGQDQGEEIKLEQLLDKLAISGTGEEADDGQKLALGYSFKNKLRRRTMSRQTSFSVDGDDSAREQYESWKSSMANSNSGKGGKTGGAGCSSKSPRREELSSAPSSPRVKPEFSRAFSRSESPQAVREAVVSVYDNALFSVSDAEGNTSDASSLKLTTRRLQDVKKSSPYGAFRASSEPPHSAAQSAFGRRPRHAQRRHPKPNYNTTEQRQAFFPSEIGHEGDDFVDFGSNQTSRRPSPSRRRQQHRMEPAVFTGATEPRRKSKARPRRRKAGKKKEHYASPPVDSPSPNPFELTNDIKLGAALGFLASAGGIKLVELLNSASAARFNRAVSEPPPNVPRSSTKHSRRSVSPALRLDDPERASEGVGRWGGRTGESGNYRSTSACRDCGGMTEKLQSDSVEGQAAVARGLWRAKHLVPGSKRAWEL